MAEPKPAAEKPNLVAVAPEPKPAEKAATKPAETKTAPAAAKAAGAKKEEQGTRWGLWLLVLLLVGAAGTAWYQTQQLTQAEGRVTALSEQVLGLEAQVAAANLQIHTFEMQRTQVREAVTDLSNRMLLLSELVGGPISSSEAPEPTPTP